MISSPITPACRADPGNGLPRGAFSPLIPVLVPLAVAAIVLAAVFSRIFPYAQPAGKAPAARYVDVARDSGITFTHDNGSWDGQDSPTTLPGAVAFLDYDDDGRPDLFFVGGIAWPWNPPARAGGGHARCTTTWVAGGSRT